MAKVTKTITWEEFVDGYAYDAFVSVDPKPKKIESEFAHALDNELALCAVEIIKGGFTDYLRRDFGHSATSIIERLDELDFYRVVEDTYSELKIYSRLLGTEYIFKEDSTRQNGLYVTVLKYIDGEMTQGSEPRSLVKIINPESSNFKKLPFVYSNTWRKAVHEIREYVGGLSEQEYLGAIVNLGITPEYIAKKLVAKVGDAQHSDYAGERIVAQILDSGVTHALYKKVTHNNNIYILEYEALGLRLLLDIKKNEKFSITLKDAQIL